MKENEEKVCVVNSIFKVPVMATKTVTVASQTGRVIMARTVCGERDGLSTEHNVLFEASADLPKAITIDHSIVRTVDLVRFPVLVTNDSKENFEIKRNTVLGYISNDFDTVSATTFKPASPPQNPTPNNHKFTFEKANIKETEILNKLLDEFSDIFSNNNSELGRTNLIQHKIDTGGHTPIRQRAYRIPISQKPAMREHIKNMLATGVISPSYSPWSSPVLLVKYKTSGETRLVCDYRRLNEISKKCAFPLPLIDETLSLLHGKAFFSVLDLMKGYFQVEMAPEDREKQQ